MKVGTSERRDDLCHRSPWRSGAEGGRFSGHSPRHGGRCRGRHADLCDSQVLAAAVLHDTVEDAGVELEEIRARFGGRVAALVGVETEDKMRHLPPEQSWRARKEEAIARLRAAEDPGAAIVTLGDKLSNLRSLYRGKEKKGDAVWADFYQNDPEAHHWYYRTMAEVLTPLAESAAWREYDWLIRQAFEED